MRILLLALALTACSCSSEQIAPDSAQQMADIANAYGAARAVEIDHCPYGHPSCPNVRALGYRAESAYVHASGERTRKAIATAREAVLAFSNAAKGLQ
jgi:hypothetical protein